MSHRAPAGRSSSAAAPAAASASPPRPACRRGPGASAGAALARRGLRRRLPARPVAAPRHLVVYVFAREADGRRPSRGSASPCRARSAAPSSATASSGCCARRSPRCGSRPRGIDVVCVARPRARRGCRRAEGSPGCTRPSSREAPRAAARGARRERGRPRPPCSCCARCVLRLALRARPAAARAARRRAAAATTRPARTTRAEAMRTHGPVRGSWLAAWRVLRCNPWCTAAMTR